MPTHPKPPLSDPTDLARFQLFVTAVSDYAIYMLSPEGYVNSWNAGAQRFKGYTAPEILGKHFSLFYTEEDRANGRPQTALHTALTKGKFEDEGWRVRQDGTRFWASVVIDPIHDEDGTLVGFAKITRDITERKLAQEALRESEQRFRLLVQGVTDYAIYMLSPEGQITNWNAGAERIKGYTHDEVVGTHFSRFYTAEDRQAGTPNITLRTASREGRFESEGWRVRKDGTRFWASVVLDAIHNEAGELVGFAKITRDITEKKQANEALERAKAALFHSQKLEAIGKLTGGVAHDFNNLLAVIVSGLDLFASKVTTPGEARVFESMQRAADRGAKLTQQLLSFARQQPLQRNKFNLNRVIASFEAVLRRACHDSIDFKLALDPLLPRVLIDATQFEAALLNLVANSRDAMPDGGVLTVSTETVQLQAGDVDHLAPGTYVKVTVRDTGTGMTPEVAARAVEPFFTTKGVGKGTGMGLSQVYGLVHQSEGDVTISTAPGSGTAISIFLPALPADTADAQREVDAGKDKALVVDDQPEVLDVAAELFRSMGYEVLSANNGKDALDILKRTPDVNVLFTDVLMPGISGIELGRAAKKLLPGLKVLLASGYPAPALANEGGGFGDFGFVNKPYRISEIMRMLRAPV
ncbi:MAG: hybrid sensor histidine kinase/response regulator [Paucimonas sp.]|nr:hybrid sensor histidine kinase/response regulator [Paucimonas sp.]